ncbi:hypothetical protein HMPREF0083_01099 [Aneurinibacillus aneurinilyticus ATCC 12856]|uniref:Ada DNA repair metal-binding domain-containing protein n=1 Tax=Aneurinibacillus aneurinilyticus ATCC 12856 TaxID=649747 RepID=U1X745_ANEAE|nr:hypothetical protein HMPREF0083_01099 [Aneurinibacillus aneurinilyticus ATCC 12856]
MKDNINNEYQESHENGILNDMDMMTDEKWQAIIDNDASYNEQFFYAVKTTGICLANPVFQKKKMYVFFKT